MLLEFGVLFDPSMYLCLFFVTFSGLQALAAWLLPACTHITYVPFYVEKEIYSANQTEYNGKNISKNIKLYTTNLIPCFH